MISNSSEKYSYIVISLAVFIVDLEASISTMLHAVLIVHKTRTIYMLFFAMTLDQYYVTCCICYDIRLILSYMLYLL